MKQKLTAAAMALCILAGGAVTGRLLPTGEKAADAVLFAAQVTPVGSLSAPVTLTATKGRGAITHASGSRKPEAEQEELLLDFMNLYYSSLAGLEAQDPSHLFASDAQDQADYVRITWEVMVGIREMQRTDLSLTDWSYQLTSQSVTQQADGDVSILVRENSVQKFAATSGTGSSGYFVYHTFVLTQEDGRWKLRQHHQADSLYNSLLDHRQVGATTIDLSEGSLEAQRDSLLQEARANVSARRNRGTARTVKYDNEYNRKAAVAYAKKWVEQRNSRWPMYDSYGGNCQNFVSQALYSSGIPMDYRSTVQWKWYGTTPNTTTQATGRSAAWSGVAEFLSYVNTGRSYGLVAVADAPYYSGEPGDIIHLGTSTQWKHTVIITEVVRDSAGNAVDYLVASNTANLKDFPVSAYYYTNQMLIKVYGWNG